MSGYEVRKVVAPSDAAVHVSVALSEDRQGWPNWQPLSWISFVGPPRLGNKGTARVKEESGEVELTLKKQEQ